MPDGPLRCSLSGMILPDKPAVLWFAGVLLAFLLFPLLIYSGQLYYAEGGTSPDAPGMLLASVFFTAPIWGGAWLVFVALFLVRYPGAVPLNDWHAGSIAGALLAMLSIAVSALFLLMLSRVEWWRLTRVPFTLYLLAGAAYVQVLRAAAIGRSRR